MNSQRRPLSLVPIRVLAGSISGEMPTGSDECLQGVLLGFIQIQAPIGSPKLPTGLLFMKVPNGDSVYYKVPIGFTVSSEVPSDHTYMYIRVDPIGFMFSWVPIGSTVSSQVPTG